MLVIGLTAGVRYTYYACFKNVDNHVKMLNVLESTVWVHLVILTSNLYGTYIYMSVRVHTTLYILYSHYYIQLPRYK